jgi:hypothetical protein
MALRGLHLLAGSRCRSAVCGTPGNAVANAIGYAKHSSRAHDAVISVYDAARKLIEVHEHAGDFKVP